jgi:Flp pilus assembly protein TadD
MPLTKTYTFALCLSLLLSGCSMMPQKSGETSPDNAGGTAKAKVSSALERKYAAARQSMRDGKTEQAKKQLQRLAQENPKLAGPLTNLGIIQLNENDLAGAEHSFRDAIKRNPKSAQAHNQLGVALRLQGRFQEAEAAYQAALEAEPVYSLAHRNLGILYDLYLAKPKEALAHYRVCQKLAGSEDKEIEGWIIDLERRVKAK